MKPYFFYILVPSALALCGCGSANNSSVATMNVNVQVEGVSMKYTAMKMKSPRLSGRQGPSRDISHFFPGVTNTPGYNFSGPADYIKLTITKVELSTLSGEVYHWMGAVQLQVDGSGYVDTSGISISVRANETVTNLRVVFSGLGTIKGTLTGPFKGLPQVTNTFYTKSAYSTFNGGAMDYTFFTNGPAEETAVYSTGWFVSNDYSLIIDAPVAGMSYNSNLTVVIDIDRALQFYDGMGWLGMGPGSPTNKAYFYTKLDGCIAAFFGDPGTIQGYNTEFYDIANNYDQGGLDDPHPRLQDQLYIRGFTAGRRL